MPCYEPIRAWTKEERNDQGKQIIIFKTDTALKYGADIPIPIPCGKCIGCKLEKSREWAIRCLHESELYEDNCFITLTYDPKHLPPNSSLIYIDFQNFMKYLRRDYGDGIRFFMCGEYGYDETQFNKIGRPHFHACIFNHDFTDKTLWKTINGVKIYTSEQLAKLWPKGFSTVGDVNFKSAAYVARYVMEKINDDRAEDHYQRLCLETGDYVPIEPEFTNMSRRPGIGKGWWDKFKSDLDKDFITIGGVKHKPPSYYDTQLEKIDPDELRKRKTTRKERINPEEQTKARLKVKQEIKQRQLKRLKRKEIT